MPLQLTCTRLNHCHLRVSHEPSHPPIVRQRNKSVSVMLIAALFDQNVIKLSFSLREMLPDLTSFVFFLNSADSSVSGVNFSFLNVCESYYCRD